MKSDMKKAAFLIRSNIGVHSPRNETGKGGWQVCKTRRLTKEEQEEREDSTFFCFRTVTPVLSSETDKFGCPHAVSTLLPHSPSLIHSNYVTRWRLRRVMDLRIQV